MIVQKHYSYRLHGKLRLFTLVELLVVIAIISVLAGLLLPALDNAMVSARSITCLNNLKQQALLVNTYGDDNGLRYPVAYYGTGISMDSAEELSTMYLPE